MPPPALPGGRRLALPRPALPVPDERTARILGAAAGTAIAVCFVTGVISHVHQHPLPWFDLPPRPVRAYQVSQGLHVASGIAAIPLVLAKLWTVFPRLFQWPPVRSVGHGLDRLLLAPLVGGTLFELTTGLLNVTQWYPWHFSFPAVHGAVAWVVAGATLLHVASRLPARRTPTPDATPTGPAATSAAPPTATPGPDRRAVLAGVGTAVGAVTLATAGQTVAPLADWSPLAARRPAPGPTGLPVNRTAAQAGVTALAADPGWRLTVTGPRPLSLSLADLERLPRAHARLPIACVEGWSATATWTGVRLRDVLAAAEVPEDAAVRVVSLEPHGGYGTSTVAPGTARDPLTLLALRLDGAPLPLDHGYPVRLMAPNRPGVLQTKWLTRIEVAR